MKTTTVLVAALAAVLAFTTVRASDITPAEIKAIAVFGSRLYGGGMDGLWLVSSSRRELLVVDQRPVTAIALACSGVHATLWFEPRIARYAP